MRIYLGLDTFQAPAQGRCLSRRMMDICIFHGSEALTPTLSRVRDRGQDITLRIKHITHSV
jgi:hypothetical protein